MWIIARHNINREDSIVKVLSCVYHESCSSSLNAENILSWVRNPVWWLTYEISRGVEVCNGCLKYLVRSVSFGTGQDYKIGGAGVISQTWLLFMRNNLSLDSWEPSAKYGQVFTSLAIAENVFSSDNWKIIPGSYVPSIIVATTGVWYSKTSQCYWRHVSICFLLTHKTYCVNVDHSTWLHSRVVTWNAKAL